MDAPDYLVARLFRLLPLVIASSLLYLLVTSPSPRELLANMVLLSTSMNGVLWSLQVEMIGSMGAAQNRKPLTGGVDVELGLGRVHRATSARAA